MVDVSRAPSRALLEALAGFGLAVAWREASRTKRAGMLRLRRAVLAPGAITLVTGPSGSGKSRLVRSLRDACESLGCACVRVDLAGTPVDDAPNILDAVRARLARGVEQAGSGAEPRDAMYLLTQAALADATLLPRTPHELSEGERARLRIALAMADVACLRRAEPDRPVVVLLDEFASVLDRVTARALCCTLTRWVRRDAKSGGGMCCVVATAHDDVAAWLTPDVRVACSLRGPPRVRTCPPREPAA